MPHRAIDFSKPIPMFPLPNCVLLPAAPLPLHIFEARYRQMVTDAINGRRLIAMALFEGDQWQEDYEGNPPVRPSMCVGYILRHQDLPDGRYNVLLQGLCRVELIEEVQCAPYRQGRFRPVEDPTNEIDLHDERLEIERLLTDPLLQTVSHINNLHHWVSDELLTAALIDVCVAAVCDNIECRYKMLREGDSAARAEWLIGHLSKTRQCVQAACKRPPAMTKEGLSLN
jgi:Lon protease-like protein